MKFSIMNTTEINHNDIIKQIESLDPNLKYQLMNGEDKIDYLFVFGGDGTFLNALRSYQEQNIKIIFIKSTKLSFLYSLKELSKDIFDDKKYQPCNFIRFWYKKHRFDIFNEININFFKAVKIKYEINDKLFKNIICSEIELTNYLGSTGIARSRNLPIFFNDHKIYLTNFINEPKYHYYQPLLQPILLDKDKVSNFIISEQNPNDFVIKADNVKYDFKHELNIEFKARLLKSKALILNINDFDLFTNKVNELF